MKIEAARNGFEGSACSDASSLRNSNDVRFFATLNVMRNQFKLTYELEMINFPTSV